VDEDVAFWKRWSGVVCVADADYASLAVSAARIWHGKRRCLYSVAVSLWELMYAVKVLKKMRSKIEWYENAGDSNEMKSALFVGLFG